MAVRKVNAFDANGNQVFITTLAELVKNAAGKTLENVEAGAQVNIIEKVKIGDSEVSVVNKTVTIPASYTKTEADEKYATKTELSAVPKFKIEVVEALPTSNIGAATIYLQKTGNETDNLYTEYIYVNSKWEKLGTQKLDLSGYQTKLSDAQLAAANSGVTAAKVSGYDTHVADNDIHVTTAARKAAVDSGITAAKVSKYDGYEATLNSKANSADVYTKTAADAAFAAKATSLAGYGIADAYTKSEIDSMALLRYQDIDE